MARNSRPKSVLIIGAGGIGTTVVDLLVPALVRIQLNVKITLIDGDIIETSNLGHQNYGPKDIGRHKVDALAEKWLDFEKNLIKSSLSNSHLNKELTKFFTTSYRLNSSHNFKMSNDKESERLSNLSEFNLSLIHI